MLVLGLVDPDDRARFCGRSYNLFDSSHVAFDSVSQQQVVAPDLWCFLLISMLEKVTPGIGRFQIQFDMLSDLLMIRSPTKQVWGASVSPQVLFTRELAVSMATAAHEYFNLPVLNPPIGSIKQDKLPLKWRVKAILKVWSLAAKAKIQELWTKVW